MAVTEASLANLVDFNKGPDSRRANGRSLGASWIEWTNRLDDASEGELARIKADKTQPHSKRLAAASILRSHTDGFAKNGTPIAANDLDRLLDRTHGKPTQRVEVQQQEVKDPAALRVELVRLLAEHPELKAALSAEVTSVAAPALPAARALHSDCSRTTEGTQEPREA